MNSHDTCRTYSIWCNKGKVSPLKPCPHCCCFRSENEFNDPMRWWKALDASRLKLFQHSTLIQFQLKNISVWNKKNFFSEYKIFSFFICFSLFCIQVKLPKQAEEIFLLQLNQVIECETLVNFVSRQKIPPPQIRNEEKMHLNMSSSPKGAHSGIGTRLHRGASLGRQ